MYLGDPGQCVDLCGSVIRVVAPYMVSEAGVTHYMVSEVGLVRCGVDSPEAPWGGHLLRPYPLAMTPDKVHWNRYHSLSLTCTKSLVFLEGVILNDPTRHQKELRDNAISDESDCHDNPLPPTPIPGIHGKHKHILDY